MHSYYLIGDIIFEFIKNNYLINIDEYFYKNNYIFYKNKNNYYFISEVKNKKNLYKLYYYFINGYFYKIIFNKKGKFISTYQNKDYILLKYIKYNFKLEDLIYKNKLALSNKKKLLTWRNIWIDRSNYIEEKYQKIINKYNIIDESIDYFYGLLEAAIYLLRDYQKYYDYLYLQHIFINYFDYYNPCNIKLDVKERDFSNYLKYLFFSNKYKDIYIDKIIIKNLDNYNFNLILARLIYPDYYFNLLDELIDNNYIFNNNIFDEIKNIILLVDDYELYISNIYRVLLENKVIKKVDFINLH